MTNNFYINTLNDKWRRMEPSTKHLFDISAVLVAFGSLLEYLPTISAGLSVIWLSLQIYFALEKRYKEHKEKK